MHQLHCLSSHARFYDNHVHSSQLPIYLIGKQSFCNTNNMVSDYYHLKTDFLVKKRQKVVRLWPHLLYHLLRKWMILRHMPDRKMQQKPICSWDFYYTILTFPTKAFMSPRNLREVSNFLRKWTVVLFFCLLTWAKRLHDDVRWHKSDYLASHFKLILSVSHYALIGKDG